MDLSAKLLPILWIDAGLIENTAARSTGISLFLGTTAVPTTSREVRANFTWLPL